MQKPDPLKTREVLELDYLAAQLRALPKLRGVARAFAIGELVLAQLFAGDPTAWRTRRRNKAQSLRGLALRKNCPFSKSTLSQAVNTYVTLLELTQFRHLEHVSASHVALVARLPAPERAAMVSRIEREKWSVRDLRARIAQPTPTSTGNVHGNQTLREARARLGSLNASLRRLEEPSSHVEAWQETLGQCVVELAALHSDILALERAIHPPHLPGETPLRLRTDE